MDKVRQACLGEAPPEATPPSTPLLLFVPHPRGTLVPSTYTTFSLNVFAALTLAC